QRVADTFRKGPVFLAGDAAHTYSSGAAQGMNSGLHDAFNLGWKLAGVLSGLYHEDILDTYASERRPSAEKVIELDKDIAALVSGNIPEHFNALPNADPYDYLDILRSHAMFTTGVGIIY
ncbi:FAD binding domain-containing protein, partial [Mycena galopus ATCC 62051]